MRYCFCVKFEKIFPQGGTLIMQSLSVYLVDKSQILARFSADPDRYYTVELFKEKGFDRRSCRVCGRFYWSTQQMDTCPDHDPRMYSFIGQPPTSKRLDYTEAWKKIDEFFVANGHTSIPRYPVVCRWRDDLYYTIASIVDFQRVSGSQVTFQFPANPLIVPQTCLRFKDIENVGVTGRHFSSFCMVGQHAVPDTGGYWKDTCIKLDHALLTGPFGIHTDEITFVEDVWAGGGSFGPSLEYFVRGLELGNAVFTEFQGTIEEHTTLKHRIIDMGAGLERFAWITMGTPTAYDCCFGPALDIILDRIGADPSHASLNLYYTGISRGLDTMPLSALRESARKGAGITEDVFKRVILPLEKAYMVADHIRTLIFAIADGSLPSNVGGGYNLRMMVRRIADSGISNIHDIIAKQIDYLAYTYPELDKRRDDVRTIIDIETDRYHSTRGRMAKVASRIKNRGDAITVAELVTLYESDGITPEYLVECGAIPSVPDGFAARLADLHRSGKRTTTGPSDIPLPATEPLYYKDDPHEFDARVLAIHDNSIILDRTSFYPRSGGQEPDRGSIGGCRISDVEKVGDTILHKTDDKPPAVGSVIRCAIDTNRRTAITRHHTATHIINAASRRTLGSWVWQHSAHKDAHRARLDITHHSALTKDQIQGIQDAANDIIRQDLPVSIRYMDRGSAEASYGFSIYQGGVVPVDTVRIVSIGDIDIEACGGTHVPRTGMVKRLTITRAKRIQDGVVRLEFTVNEPPARKEQGLRQAARHDHTDTISRLCRDILTGSRHDSVISYNRGACVISDEMYDQRFHTTLSKKLIKTGRPITYCGFFRSGPAIRVMVCCKDSPHDAMHLAGTISEMLGGRAAGTRYFAQGGGRQVRSLQDSILWVREAIL